MSNEWLKFAAPGAKMWATAPRPPRPAGPSLIFLSFCSKLRPLLATPLASIPMIYHKRLAEIIDS